MMKRRRKGGAGAGHTTQHDDACLPALMHMLLKLSNSSPCPGKEEKKGPRHTSVPPPSCSHQQQVPAAWDQECGVEEGQVGDIHVELQPLAAATTGIVGLEAWGGGRGAPCGHACAVPLHSCAAAAGEPAATTSRVPPSKGACAHLDICTAAAPGSPAAATRSVRWGAWVKGPVVCACRHAVPLYSYSCSRW